MITAILVAGAVLIIPIFVAMASNPVRTFRRVSLAVLLISCIPNLVMAFWRDAGVDWGMLVLMVLHVVAWAVTVPMLTRLTVITTENEAETP